MNYENIQIAALADPTRQRIFALIGERPRTVVAITREMPVSQPAVSQHLKVLREASLVRAEPSGASNVYHIDPDGLGQMRAWIDRFWGNTLAAYKQVAEQSKEEPQ